LKRKQENLTVLLILGLVLATLMILPGCTDQSETKNSETQRKEKDEVEKTPASETKPAPETGKPGKDGNADEGKTASSEGKPDPAQPSEQPAAGDPNEAEGPVSKDPDGKAGKSDDKDKKDGDKKEEPLEDPNDPLEAINFKDFELGKLMDKVGQWTGKVIIPIDGKVLKEKVTIYSTKKQPRSKALNLIYTVLRTKGFVAEEQDGIIFLKPLKDAKLMSVPTIPADQPLAMIADKEMIAQKFFHLKEYPPGKMKEMIAPLVPEYGYVNADETTKSLIVIDTVGNLQRIEGYIRQLDVAEEEEMQRRIFEIHQGDPTEIAQLLKIIMSAGYPELERRSRYSRYSYRGGSRSSGLQRSGSSGSGPEPVIIPEPTRRWIIVKATEEDMVKIEEWITKLDRKEPVDTDYTIIPVEYADVDEIADMVETMLERIPSSELQPNVRVIDLEQNSTLLVFGSLERRELVGKLVEELDVPPDKQKTVHVKLKYTEPDQIKQYVMELFTERPQRYRSTSYEWGYRQDYYRTTSARKQTRVISYPTLNMVSVIADPNQIDDIVSQIKEWDQPLDVDTVKPLILELKNSDPVKMANLLSSLFSEERSRSSDFMDYIFGYGRRRQTTQLEVVGPLYGKLSFEAVPDTKKIIVISQIPEAYKVIQEFVEELDRQEIAELPMVVVLKYANPEDLCERLNALLNEPGTEATIHLAKRALTSYVSGASDTDDSGGRVSDNRNATNRQQQSNIYKPWWTGGQRRREEEQPISNIIGQIRFIPDYRSKAVLVLSPPEYRESVRQMIEELDKPAKQVMVKATILAIDLKEESSIGVQLANDPTVFGSFTESSLDIVNALRYAETFGSVSLSSSMDVTVLIDFLVKNVNAKIMNEPTLWAKDNEEATFFRGRTIPFIAASQSSSEGSATTQTFSERNVGVTLRVRPNITPEKAIDMELNLIISRQEPELILGNTATSETNTTTHLIVEDGTTVLLSGILFQQDVEIERKLPLFGDIPVVGELFKHKELLTENSEVMIFLTPYVIEDVGEGPVAEEYERAREKLNEFKVQMNNWLEEMHPEKG